MSGKCYSLSFVIGLMLYVGSNMLVAVAGINDETMSVSASFDSVTVSFALQIANAESSSPSPNGQTSRVATSDESSANSRRLSNTTTSPLSDSQNTVSSHTSSSSSANPKNSPTTSSSSASKITSHSTVERSSASLSVNVTQNVNTSLLSSSTAAFAMDDNATFTQEWKNAVNGTKGQDLAVTSWHSDLQTVTYYTDMADNATENSEAPIVKGTSFPMLVIYIVVPVGVCVVAVVVVVVICVVYRRHRRKAQAHFDSVHMTSRAGSLNEYENLDYLDYFLDTLVNEQFRHRQPNNGAVVRSETARVSSSASSHVASSGLRATHVVDYRELNEALLTLKRPLETSVNDGVFSEDLMCLINDASTKILDVMWHVSGTQRPNRSHTPLQDLFVSVREFLSINFLFVESLFSLQMKIVALLSVFPPDGVITTISRCRRSLESLDALLNIGMENISYTSPVNSDCEDLLLESNPVFLELLGQVTTVRFRLETCFVLGFAVDPDDTWKSKLFECLAGTESNIKDAFSDVVEELPTESGSAPEGEDVVEELATESVSFPEGEENFRSTLEQKLSGFCRSTGPVVSEAKRFLQGVNSRAADYLSAVLDEINHLISSILDPTLQFTMPNHGDGSAIYQNLNSVYDTPQSSTYLNLPACLPGNVYDEYDVPPAPILPPLNDDLYEDSRVNSRPSFDDSISSYGYDDDCFDVSVDRTSASWLEDLLQLYRQTSLNQLQRSIRVTYVGEAGFDGGALSREFFFLSFNGLISQPLLSHGLFEGMRGHLLPAIDHVLTDARVYWFVGVLIAQAVNRGCKGLPGLCNAVRLYLFHGAKIKSMNNDLEKVTAEDIADLELQAVIIKVEKKETLTEEEKAVFETWARASSFSKVLGPSTETEAIQRIFCHYVFNSRMTQLQAIAEGIADIGIKNRQTVEIERMFPSDDKLSYNDFMSGILIEPTDSKQRKTRDYFKQFCQELYKGNVDGLALENLLQFFTGANYFASMHGAQVRFADPVEKNALPTAHACASELILPTVHKRYSNFRDAMVKALELSGTGFGMV